MRPSRRTFLTRCAAGALATGVCRWKQATKGASVFGSEPVDGAASTLKPLYAPDENIRIDATERTFHVSSAVEMFEQYGDLPEIWADAGVTDAWLCAWFYGYFPYSWDKLDYWLGRIKKAGLRPHLISVPFCHGGGALDPRDANFPNLPPEHWKTAKRWDGSENWGFSWHSPADVESAAAIRTLKARYGKFNYFLDDDFRFSSSPSQIGGCVCPECRADFLKKAGLAENRWEETLDDLRNNADTPLLRAWVDYFCDRLTACYRTQQAADPAVDVGIMVMYMGCERGGIRLDDYRDSLFRVGEGMFSDSWFAPPKNKTIELFSSLLHRRFCAPGRAFSETTVFPEGTLSPENMASKLSVSTISDVRNTCFMSGLRAIPPKSWPILSSRMKAEKAFHTRLGGAKLAGPFKHYYGVASRYLGGDNAYSLFLALGVPFEVCDEIPSDGWTFLSDGDAAAMERGALRSGGSTCVARFASQSGRFSAVAEDFDSLFTFRRSILERLRADGVPYVEEERPVVLAWKPEARALYLWNVLDEDLTLTLRRGSKRTTVALPALGSALVEEATFAEV